MEPITCPKCGKEVSDIVKFCPDCGYQIKKEVTTCPKCGKEVSDIVKFCPDCGYQIKRRRKKAFSKKLVLMLGLAIIMIFSVSLFITMDKLPYNKEETVEERKRNKYLKEIDIVSETFPNTGITPADVRMSILKGETDWDEMLEYVEDISSRTEQIITTFQDAIRDKETINKDINISELEDIVIDFLIDIEKYKETNSLFVKRSVQIDTWVVQLGLKYCKQYSLAKEEKHTDEAATIGLEFVDMIYVYVDDKARITEIFEEIQDLFHSRG